jgi:hypothetical protein
MTDSRAGNLMSIGTITIADGLLILATFLGPILAVQVQKWLERSREVSERKQHIFYTLMATRAVRAASNEHVQALNLIELVFRNRSERPVRDAWAIYFDFLLQRTQMETPAEVKAWNEKATDLLVTLLSAMAMALHYDFDEVKLKRGAYHPQAHQDELSARKLIRTGLINVLKGDQAVPMKVIVSEDAIKVQQDLQSALLRVLSGQTPLMVRDFKEP